MTDHTLLAFSCFDEEDLFFFFQKQPPLSVLAACGMEEQYLRKLAFLHALPLVLEIIYYLIQKKPIEVLHHHGQGSGC